MPTCCGVGSRHRRCRQSRQGPLVSGHAHITPARVTATSFMLCRLAGTTSTASGMPCRSVSRLRLTPPLPRSVGLGPIFFPGQRGFGHRAIQCQPIPVDPFQIIVFQQAEPPEIGKYPGIDPFPEASNTQQPHMNKSPSCPGHAIASCAAPTGSHPWQPHVKTLGLCLSPPMMLDQWIRSYVFLKARLNSSHSTQTRAKGLAASRHMARAGQFGVNCSLLVYP